MKKFALCLYFFILSLLPSSALCFRYIAPEDGLTYASVVTICQDSIGRLWFGTEDGLNVFDGNKTESFLPGNSTHEGSSQFEGNHVKNLVCSHNGTIFFSTGEGLYLYDIQKEQFRNLYRGKVRSVFIHDKVVWAATPETLLYFQENTGVMREHSRHKFKNITSFFIDSQNRYYYGTQTGLYRTTDFIQMERIVDAPIFSIFESSTHDVWVGSNTQGIIRISPQNQYSYYNTSLYKEMTSDDVRYMDEDRNGNIWFGTFKGLHMLSLKENKLTVYQQDIIEGHLNHSSVFPVLIDNNNMLWVGTYYGGVNYANLDNMSHLLYTSQNKAGTLSHPLAGDIVKDKRGAIWVATEGGGLNKFDRKSEEFLQFRDSKNALLPASNVKTLYYDSIRDEMLIGTHKSGLFRFDLKNEEFTPLLVHNGYFNNVNAIKQYKDIFILNTENGIYSYKEGKVSLFAFPGEDFLFLDIDSQGYVWIAMGAKIHKIAYDNVEDCHIYDIGESPNSAGATYLHIDERDQVWVCTTGRGVIRFDAEKNDFIPLFKENSIPFNEYAYRVAITPQGHVVVSGSDGVVVATEGGSILQLFRLNQDIPLSSINRGSGLFSDEEGVIYAGGGNGLLVFKPQSSPKQVEQENIYFTHLEVNGRKVYPEDESQILHNAMPYTKKITLTAQQQQIRLTLKSASNQSLTLFEYRLDDTDKEWHTAKENVIAYNRLPYGKHTLQVRRVSTDSSQSTYKSLVIEVLRPWYITPWAIAGYVVFFIGISYLTFFIILRKKRYEWSIAREKIEKENLREVNESKLRFFTSISHEFRTPLAIITGQIELLSQQKNSSPYLVGKLNGIKQQSDQLNNLIGDLIDFRKYEEGKMVLRVAEYPINEYMEGIYSSFSSLAFQRNISFSFTPLEQNVQLLLDAQQMGRALYNIIYNAFKYTPNNGTIACMLSEDADSVRIAIADSGIGIASEDIPHIFTRFYQTEQGKSACSVKGSGIGLALVKDVVTLHRGSVTVESKLEYGSLFTICLPKGSEVLSEEHVQRLESVDAQSLSMQSHAEAMVMEQTPEEGDTPLPSFPKDKNYTVLIVEDNEELSLILEELFAPFYMTETAKNGQEGLDKCIQLKPDLVVSDVMMPVMSGSEMCSKIKNHIEVCHIPVVLLTALNLPKHRLEGVLCGADDYIGKPFDSKLLLAKCYNLLQLREMLRRELQRETHVDVSYLTTNNADKEFLDKAIHLINLHMDTDDFGVEKLAQELCMSRSSFHAKIKALAGVTPNDFIVVHKLKLAAKELLEHPEFSVREVSEHFGFGSSSYFGRRFKEQFGKSPLEYRSLARPAETLCDTLHCAAENHH